MLFQKKKLRELSFQNLKMKITQNIEPEVEITQRIAYSVSALMKLNIISEVISTDNANLQPMQLNKWASFVKSSFVTATVVGCFGRLASFRTGQRM
jgi:hypothetical protein